MGTPYDPNNSLHAPIIHANGIPIPQRYDQETNNGQGGMVPYEGKTFININGNSLFSVVNPGKIAAEAGAIADLATFSAKVNEIKTMLTSGTAKVEIDIANVTLDTNQSNITVPAEVTLNGSKAALLKSYVQNTTHLDENTKESRSFGESIGTYLSNNDVYPVEYTKFSKRMIYIKNNYDVAITIVYVGGYYNIENGGQNYIMKQWVVFLLVLRRL